MAVREFNGSTDNITLSGGTVGAICNAAHSFVFVIKPTALAAGEAFLSINNSTTTLRACYDNGGAGGQMGMGGDSGGDSLSGTANLSAGAWQVIGASKASGTVIARFHRKPLGSGSYTHIDGSGTCANNATSCDNFRVSCFGNASGFKDTRLAVAAVFSTNLTDTDYANIESNASTAYLQSLSPAALWEFNQTSTGTNVTDLIGTANQTAISGTTVINGDDPTWTFSAAATTSRMFSAIPLVGGH